VENFLQKNITLLILNRIPYNKIVLAFMIINIICFLIFSIFSFLIYLIIKSLIRGFKGKNKK
jgi:energy-converting hydrogenase Eha subunit H